jgi:DNA-binding IscR family transcriptional regulator
MRQAESLAEPTVRRRLVDAAGMLTTPLLPDDYLTVFNPLWAFSQLRGRIEQVIARTADAATVVIRPGRRWPQHRAGQHTAIGVDVDGVRHWRSYSLTSDPGRPDGCISVTVKAVDGGVVSTHLVRAAKVGDIVRLGPPEGDFHLPGDITRTPLLLITAVGLTGGSQFQSAKDFITQTPVIGKLIFQLLPVFVLWLAFAFVYQLLPNTKVKFSAALVGGAVAGTLWHLNNVFGFLFISRVATNSKIYGGLGLVPVFMIGIYFSWVILLFGAQIAYAYQNRAAYLQDRLADNVNQRGREFVALRIMTCLGQRFQNGLRPATVIQLSAELGIPSRLTQSVLRIMEHMGLVTEVAGAEAAFVPARPLENINAYDILLAMRTGSGQELPLRGEPELAEIYGEFARIEKAERETASAISMLALVNRSSPPPALAEPEVVHEEKLPAFAIAPEKIPTPKKIEVAEIKIEPPVEEPEPRRETVRPGESEFPL